jgi:hypothetical protein
VSAREPVETGVRSAASRRGPLLVLTVTGLIGFVIGITKFATWQVAVESAQVVAGLVAYPADHPFYIYHMKLWTIAHQICAILLKAGVSEIVLSKAISGLLGMLSFQALGVLVFAFSEDVLLSIATPLVILYTQAAIHGANYPIALMGTDHTYGVLGLSTAALVVGLIGAGCYRSGGFLLGLAPAIHPSIGGWLNLVVAACVLWDYRRLRAELPPAQPWFAAGAGLTAVSLVVLFAMARGVPSIDAAEAGRYVSAFVDAWDDHRRPAYLVSVATILNAIGLIVASIWLRWFTKDLPRPSVFALRVVAAAAALSLPLIFVSWLPSSLVPTALLILMPSRFVNFNVLMFVPLVVGLLAGRRDNPWTATAALAFLAALFTSYRSLFWDGRSASGWLARQIQFNPWHVFVAVSIVLVVLRVTPKLRDARSRGLAQAARSASLLLAGLCAFFIWRLPPSYPMLDRTNNALYAAAAAERQGLLATGGTFHLVQLYTRRPVLLDGGALDGITYAPAGGPKTERILREVYGIDFFNPPDEARRVAGIPHRINKPVWEGYSRLKWQEIGHDFDVTQVLTRADWVLDLPIEAEDQFLKLYRIPR